MPVIAFVQELVAFVRKRDKRVQAYKVEFIVVVVVVVVVYTWLSPHSIHD